METYDQVLSHCCLESLTGMVEKLQARYSLEVIKQPSVCLVMLRAEDSVEGQEFYLGEALATDCEVSHNGSIGYGICLGDEPARSYCIAAIDALFVSGAHDSELESFLSMQQSKLEAREAEENTLIQRTRVDFKMMEQA
jgi:alpha-D-ribose 1-methylphosphonate 5-triphosphate synthase subunit PhnG